MTFPNLNLKPLRELTLSVPRLENQIQSLRSITSHIAESGSLDRQDQIAELRESLRSCRSFGGNFADFTRVRRRESRLLCLYMMDLGDPQSRELLPAFDENVAFSILGEGPLKKHIRTLATHLYFAHFGVERIPALNWLAHRLRQSWKNEDERRLFDPESRTYRRLADSIFSQDAPTEVAKGYREAESFDQFAERFAVPASGEFRERLLEEVILERIKKAPKEGTGQLLDQLVQEAKSRRLRTGHPLGAEAVRILIDRSISSFNSVVPAGWREQLVAYACDPRATNQANQALWWGWASKRQKEVAIRSLTELTLRQFIDLLEESVEGTGAEAQFERRAEMLLKIFDLGKVIDARLVIHEGTFFSLLPRTRQALMAHKTSGGPQHTSFVILKCTDDVFLIEGTHSFALRGFLGAERFPIPGIWSSKAGSHFPDSQFRVAERRCQIFQRHHVGNWVWDFRSQLRQHQIEWNGL